MKKIATGLLLIVMATPSFAGNGTSLEILIGTASHRITGEDYSESDDDGSNGFRFAYGFSELMTFELTSREYGELSETFIDMLGDSVTEKFASSELSLGIKASATLSSGWLLIGRLGLSMWDFEYTTPFGFPGIEILSRDQGSDFYYGAGVQYEFNERVFAGLEMTMLKIDAELFGDFSYENKISNTGFSFGINF